MPLSPRIDIGNETCLVCSYSTLAGTRTLALRKLTNGFVGEEQCLHLSTEVYDIRYGCTRVHTTT